ncbi:MAG: malectin domain-containing carbohydrate-binding protein [Candidatus Acidiferrales bacterium]
MKKHGFAFYALGLAVFLVAVSLPALAQVNVTTQHNDLNRSGDNLSETILTKSNVNATTFGLLDKITVDNQVYAQPLVVSGLTIGGGTHNVVYVATTSNSVYAFDADTGTQYWHVNLGTPISNAAYGTGCVDINGNAGIVGTPVIDTANNTIYVVNSLNNPSGTYSFQLHALSLTTGADNSGSPKQISATGFVATAQNQRAGLLLANGNVYVPFSSHCDMGTYHGYLMSYNPTTLAQNAVFNTSPSGNGDSLWESGQAPAVDSSGNIYFGTSNGTWDGTSNFSESFIKLSPALALEDWFTAANHSTLDGGDLDLDTSGPLLIPGSTRLFMVGKSSTGYVINSANLGHLGDASAVQTVKLTGALHGSAVYFNSAVNGQEVYTWDIGDTLKAFQYNGNDLNTPAFQAGSITIGGEPAAYLSLSANGTSNGILWANGVLSGNANHGSVPGVLYAYDADTLSNLLYSNQQNASRDSCNNFAKNGYPTIANGKVYLGSFGTANAGSGQLCIYGLFPTSCPTPTNPSGLTATAVSSSQVNLSWTASTSSGCSVSYSVFRSTTSGFTPSSGNQIASSLFATTYSDTTGVPSTTYYYLVEATVPGATSGPSNQATATTGAPITTIEINAGDSAVSPYVADEDFTGGSTINHANTINTSNVTNPAPAAVYQTARIGNFTYTIPGFAPNSSQLVRLHFAETFHTACATREFNVSINGTQVLTNFDIYCTAGGINIANVQQFTENANASGQYVITFTTVLDNSLVSGIQIEPSGSCTAPTAPSGLGATAISSSQINLSWTASSSSCGVTYNVFRSTTSGFTAGSGNQIATGVSTTTYSDTGLTASTTYYYLVEGTNSGGTSGPSNQASATTSASSCAAAPTAPSGLGASAISSSQINLTWTASTAGTGCTITYSVFRSTTSGFTAGSGNQIATGVTSTAYPDTGLAASTTYYYLVEGVDSAGSSAASNQASATTSASSGSCTSICIDSGSTTTVTPFVADEDYTGGATISHANTINLNNVTNPAPMAVYQKGRDGNFTYTIGGFTASSMHTVRLHFAETYWTACGQRTFNVSINSTTVLTDFDILCTAGGENIANIQQFSEAANSSGQYVIVFTTVVNNSLVNGIEID